jgi:membrane protein implicated in regulation of membrane protease activity
MNLATFYLVCFAIGFAFSALSFFSGSLRLHLPGHGHLHFGGHAGAAAHGGHFPFLNPFSLAVFLAWFGGAGYLLTRYEHVWMLAVLGIATVAGLTGAMLIFLFIAKVLMAHDYSLDPLDYEMPGVLGRISSPIRNRGTGEIIFVQDGARRSSAARSETGEPLKAGEEVIVTRYEQGIAYVRRWDELAASAGILPEENTGASDRKLEMNSADKRSAADKDSVNS